MNQRERRPQRTHSQLPRCVCIVWLGVLAQVSWVHVSVGAADELLSPLRFERHLLNADSEFSACAVFDVNRDGRLDIFCGGFWYEAPTWRRHSVRDVVMIRGRYDDYSNLPLDVDGDGWTDVVSVNYRSQSIYWVQNPGQRPAAWQTHLIDTPGPSETGMLFDLDGDGRLDIVPNGTKQAVWYAGAGGDASRWHRRWLPQELAGHGIGAGDLDGDGLADLVSPRGWWRGVAARMTVDEPGERRQADRWVPMPEFQLHRDASIPILVHDVDGDGDQDIIWGRGHNVGLYWLEQQPESAADDTGNHERDVQPTSSSPARRRWTLHAIDTSWSCCHSLMLADLDRDGRLDLVAGKRFLGHDGKDPGEWNPLVIACYRWLPDRRSWQRDLLSQGETCAIDLQGAAADVDGDGDIDVVAAGRSGLWWLENQTPASLRVESLPETKETNHSRIRGDDFDPEPDLHTTPVYSADQPLLQFRLPGGETQPIGTRVAWGDRRQHIVSNMERVMGQLPNPAHRVPLDVREESREDADGYTRIKLTFQADRQHRVPAYLLMPDGLKGPTAAILCLHPTHVLGKSQICGLGGQPSRFYAHELAQRGFICLAPDYPTFGDYGDVLPEYVSGTMQAIWDNVRAVDLLESLPEVDRDRIGVIGHSLGGHNALFTSVFDLRLRAVVTSCGFTSFADYYGGDLTGWTSQRYMPRIATQYGKDPGMMPFDFHEVIAAIAPRPIFVSAPVHDSNFAMKGVVKAINRARPVYNLFEDDAALRAEFPVCEHDFPEEIRRAVYVWLGQHLDQD